MMAADLLKTKRGAIGEAEAVRDQILLEAGLRDLACVQARMPVPPASAGALP